MTWRCQVRTIRTKSAFAMFAEIRIQFVQCLQEKIQVLRRSGMNQIKVEGIYWGAVQDRANAADDDKINLVFCEGLENLREIKVGDWHHATSRSLGCAGQALPAFRSALVIASSE